MSELKRLADRLHPGACAVMDAYNPDQPRDERGRWGSGGPGSGARSASEHNASMESHKTAAIEHHYRGQHEAARAITRR